MSIKKNVLWLGAGALVVVGLYVYFKREIGAGVKKLNDYGAQKGTEAAQQWNDGKAQASDVTAGLFELVGRLKGDIPWGGFNGLERRGPIRRRPPMRDVRGERVG